MEHEAFKFAAAAHGAQKRKYSDEPYVMHPLRVAQIVRSVDHTEDMIVAALLHDTVEDTDVTLLDIKNAFGPSIASMVAWLTDVSTPYHGNREIRKKLDRLHLSLAPGEVQTIKIADMLDNSESIRRHDNNFWSVYRREKISLLLDLRRGDEVLWKRAADMIEYDWH